MEVKIDRRYDLPITVAQAWELLRDVRATAACMPGAQITEQLDERRYQGLVSTRIGPATMRFTGELEVLEVDTATRTLRMQGKGGDTNGSAATMVLMACIEPGASPTTSALVGQTTVQVSGKLAQFGSRFMQPVTESMLGSFVTRFSERAAALPVEAASGDDASPRTGGATPAPAPEPESLNLLALAAAVIRQWWSGLWRARR
jgi:carbon monoxide dehydrogenase subunit G